MKFTAVVVQFDQVSGWTDGPKKPTGTKTTGAASTVASAIASATNTTTLNSLAAGESIHVIVTAEDDS